MILVASEVLRHNDETKFLHYRKPSICLIGADAGHSSTSLNGFRANLHIVNDRSFAEVDAASIAREADANSDHFLLIIADTQTMIEAEMPLLCVDPIPPGGQFRAVPEQLWGVENNVSLANMEFAEFATAVDTDGVFRGFRNQQ